MVYWASWLTRSLVDAANGTCADAISTNDRAKCEIRSPTSETGLWQRVRMIPNPEDIPNKSQTQISRRRPRLAQQKCSRRHQTRNPSTIQLCQVRDDNDTSSRRCKFHLASLAIASTTPTESQPMGRVELNRCTTIHQWPHVQSHQTHPLRLRRWQGRHPILCSWLPESMGLGNTDRCCNV